MYHDYCIIRTCISFFFVLTSGRSLPATTFLAFSKPLCSHLAAQIVIQEFSNSAVHQVLSKGFPLQPKFETVAASAFTALLQCFLKLFCSAAAALLILYGLHCNSFLDSSKMSKINIVILKINFSGVIKSSIESYTS